MSIKKRLSDSIANEILTMITIEKRFLPGDQLPNENDLSEEFQISRTTLREAIRYTCLLFASLEPLFQSFAGQMTTK